MHNKKKLILSDSAFLPSAKIWVKNMWETFFFTELFVVCIPILEIGAILERTEDPIGIRWL